MTYLTINEARRKLNTSYYSLWRGIHDQRIQAQRCGNALLISSDDLPAIQTMLATRRQGRPTAKGTPR